MARTYLKKLSILLGVLLRSSKEKLIPGPLNNVTHNIVYVMPGLLNAK